MGLWSPRVDSHQTTTIEVPEKNVFVVPQDCYFPTDGNLRTQITYPKPASAITKEDAVDLLRLVGLSDLLKRFSLDEEEKEQDETGDDMSSSESWSEVLSGGQRQRLSWCRLFFHRPTFALVDEATSAVSADMATKLYKHAFARGITLVSISHHPEIDALHTSSLDLRKGGSYTLRKI